MCKRLLFICFALSIFYNPYTVRAQFTDPRTYQNAPVGVNQLELGYAYDRSNSSIDTSIIVTGAKFNLNEGIVDYTRYFGFFQRTSWLESALPIAGLGGSISGTNIAASATGTGDSEYQVATLLKGGPALSPEQFADHKSTATIGVSFSFTAPTGLYNASKLLNLGSDRWSFKPEVAYSQPFGAGQKWELDVYGNAYFFTDNRSYHGVEVLRQEPLPGIEGHLSYSFTGNLWASLDTRYSFRGDTLVNGLSQNSSQQNFILGSELNLSINAKNALIFTFAKALVHQNGPTATGFSVRYDYLWGRGYR